jgi:hypothetical protein
MILLSSFALSVQTPATSTQNAATSLKLLPVLSISLYFCQNIAGKSKIVGC